MSMTDEQFALQVDRLKLAFGPKAFDAQRLYLIQNSIRSVEYQEFIRIVNRLIATKRPNDPPLPKDFMEYAAKRREMNWQEREQKHELYCQACIDAGVVRVEHNGYGTLAICDAIDREGQICRQGAGQPWKLPKVSALGLRSQPLPWQEFKCEFDPKRPLGSLREKFSWWKEKVRTAEGYWKAMEEK